MDPSLLTGGAIQVRIKDHKLLLLLKIVPLFEKRLV